MRYVAAIGALGGGIDGASLLAALEYDPQFIAADAGTTDAGAFALGSGATAFSRAAVQRDLSMMLRAGLRARVPVIVGSVGTAGADIHVDWMLAIVEDIARDLGQDLRGVAIYCEQDVSYLAECLAAGRIRPLRHSPELEPDLLARCERVVGMVGVEALQDALASDPQFVIAGRCSDAALYAALPLMRGFAPGPAWHAGKVVECGTLACETLGAGVMVVTLRDDSFSVCPVGADLRCTPQSVAAHSLYETAHPFMFKEPSGTLDISASTYEQEDNVTVRVAGSRFVAADDYSVKLEGAEVVGFQAMIVGGVRDPLIISQLDPWLESIRRYVIASVERVMGVEIDDQRYRLGFQVYGRDAVMGDLELLRKPGHEVGIVCTTLAPSQDEATEMAKLCRQPLLHAPIPEWKGAITGFACLHSPAWVELGPLYRFCLNHVLLPGEDRAAHRLEHVNVTASPGLAPRLTQVGS